MTAGQMKGGRSRGSEALTGRAVSGIVRNSRNQDRTVHNNQYGEIEMKRREFLAAASIAPIAGVSSLAVADSGGGEQEYLEFRQYHLNVGSKKNLVGNFLKNVGIPAMNPIGIGPVGVFNTMYGPNSPTLYVLMVHKSLDTVVNSASMLMADDEYRKTDFIDTSLSEPGYVRMESSLMVAFKGLPQLLVPEKKPRIFELRTYESHSIKASKKKIEMFNEGGEIKVFLKTGLQPVFFGETLIGPKMPNLTYMLVFDDLADRDAKWKVFGGDPEWKKLRSNPEYKDTVSNITDIILRPESYSQI
ncbi:MAG: NIPSNAP family protein [Sedimentisphaerales bacterium]